MARPTLSSVGGDIEIIQVTKGAGLTHGQQLKRRVVERFVTVAGLIAINPTVQNQRQA